MTNKLTGTFPKRGEFTRARAVLNALGLSCEMREKPPVLEIYKRLPRTNCRVCGEQTCMAFAAKVWSGNLRSSQCKPVFEGNCKHLRPALMEICRGPGVIEDLEFDEDLTMDNRRERE